MVCNQSESEPFDYAIQALSSLSILACILIIASFTIITEVRTFSSKLVMNISICQIITSIQFIIPAKEYKSQIFCYTSSIIFNAADMLKIIWTACIVFTLHQVIIKHSYGFKNNFKYYLIAGWILIPVINIFPVFTGSVGFEDNNCTLKQNTAGTIWRLFIFFIPGWGFILVTLVIYGKIFIKARKLGINEENQLLIQRTQLYPWVLIMAILPLTIMRGLYAYESSCPYDVLRFFTYLMFSIQGILNSFIFFLTPSVKLSMKRYFSREGLRISHSKSLESRNRIRGSVNLLEVSSDDLE